MTIWSRVRNSSHFFFFILFCWLVGTSFDNRRQRVHIVCTFIPIYHTFLWNKCEPRAATGKVSSKAVQYILCTLYYMRFKRSRVDWRGGRRLHLHWNVKMLSTSYFNDDGVDDLHSYVFPIKLCVSESHEFAESYAWWMIPFKNSPTPMKKKDFYPNERDVKNCLTSASTM